jgi:benzodiazapine receptor
MLALSSVAAAASTPRYAKCGVAPGMCRSAAMASVGVRRSSFLRGDGGAIRVSSLEVREGRAVVAVRAVSAPASEGMRSLYIAVGIPLVLGFVDAIFNSPLQKWYFDLRKPKWQPPGPIFGGAWSLLYPLMGLASWLVWAEGGFAKQAVPLALYAVQLALNLAWQALFFGAKRLGAAFYDILALDAALVATIVAFQRVNPVAANLLKPYLAWVLFATALSWRLWDLNPNSTVDPSSPTSPPPAAPASS